MEEEREFDTSGRLVSVVPFASVATVAPVFLFLVKTGHTANHGGGRSVFVVSKMLYLKKIT